MDESITSCSWVGFEKCSEDICCFVVSVGAEVIEVLVGATREEMKPCVVCVCVT